MVWFAIGLMCGWIALLALKVSRLETALEKSLKHALDMAESRFWDMERYHKRRCEEAEQ